MDNPWKEKMEATILQSQARLTIIPCDYCRLQKQPFCPIKTREEAIKAINDRKAGKREFYCIFYEPKRTI